MHIDDEIRDLELRIVRRRHAIEWSARAARQRAVRTLVSPAGLLGAVGIGFLAAFGLARRRRSQAAARVAAHGRMGKLAGLASLLASVGFALLRAQFGSPMQMAQLVLSRLKKSPPQPVHSRY